jgi:hypothetical protein
MKLKEFALVAEIISAVAIVASLIFVGLQIQQNSRIAQVNAYQDLTAQILNLNAANSQNPALAALHVKARNREELTEIENYMLAQEMIGVIRHGDLAFLQYQQGYINLTQLENLLAPLLVNYRTIPNFINVWENMKRNVDSSFVEFVDNFILSNN